MNRYEPATTKQQWPNWKQWSICLPSKNHHKCFINESGIVCMNYWWLAIIISCILATWNRLVFGYESYTPWRCQCPKTVLSRCLGIVFAIYCKVHFPYFRFIVCGWEKTLISLITLLMWFLHCIYSTTVVASIPHYEQLLSDRSHLNNLTIFQLCLIARS